MKSNPRNSRNTTNSNKAKIAKHRENLKEPEEGHKNEKEGIDFSQVREEGMRDNINEEDLIAPKKSEVHIVGDRTKLYQEIPRADHGGQTIDLDADQSGNFQQSEGTEYGNASQQSQPGMQEEEQFNSEFHEMPEKEQDESSLNTAIALVEAYGNVKLAIPKMVAISERKLKKMQKAGEINLSFMIPRSLDRREMVSVLQFVQEFNAKMIPAFRTSDEFKQTVIPILARILKKNGLALTDTQLLILAVSQDLVVTIQHAGMAMADRREMLDVLRGMNLPAQAVVHPMHPVQPMAPVPPVNNPQPMNGNFGGPVPAQTAPDTTDKTGDAKGTITKIIAGAKDDNKNQKDKIGKTKETNPAA